MKNCPNCGSPIEPYKCKCDYCGTWYFDFTAFDMSGNVPYYVKFRTPYGVITTLARPELKTIETYTDDCYATDSLGNHLYRFSKNQSCDLSVLFHAQVNPDDSSLFRLETRNEV